jgi:hypothetical protein
VVKHDVCQGYKERLIRLHLDLDTLLLLQNAATTTSPPFPPLAFATRTSIEERL